MFIIVNGDDLYSNEEDFSRIIDEIKSEMSKMDKELTMFLIGPKNIQDIVDSYCVKNEQVREKRIKYYLYSVEQIKTTGFYKFNYYVNLTKNQATKVSVEKSLSIV